MAPRLSRWDSAPPRPSCYTPGGSSHLDGLAPSDKFSNGTMLQLGWKAGTEQYPPGELLEYAVAAEQAGFDSIDASDHFHPWAEKGQACFVWTWLGAAAYRTP